MAANARAGQPPPTAKVSDVIAHFAPTRRFGPSANQKPYSVTSLDFDDTGELALVSQDDETLQIYNCKEGKHAKELKSQKYGVDLARFAHHPQSIIYASTKGDGHNTDAIRYLSSHDNTYIRYFKGHTAAVTCLALNPSADEFLSCSHDNTVRLWDLRSPHPQGQLDLHRPHLAAWDPSATVLAVASPSAQTVLLYDARQWDKPPFASFDLRDIETAFRGAGGGSGAAATADMAPSDWTKLEFSNDGQKLLVGTGAQGHYLLNAFDGKLLAFLVRPKGSTGRVPPHGFKLLREAQQQGAKDAGERFAASGQGDCCFTPDGRYVISGSGRSTVYVWGLEGLEAGEPGPEKVMQPSFTIGAGGEANGSGNEEAEGAGIGGMAAALVAYNPRHNMIVTADKGVVLWLPEMD